MGLSAERHGSRADTAVFVGCMVLSLVALALPEAVREPVAGAVRRTVLLPLLRTQHAAAEASDSRRRLTRFRAQRDSLALVAALLPELSAENARLRGLLALGRRLGFGFVTAEVLHQAGVSDGLTLVLSAGSREGVAVLAPVVTADGLVGLVRSVDPRASIAMAWTHPDFRVSAMIEGARIYGVVAARHGERSGEVMELRGVAYRDALRPGTRVVTSGLGGVFPRGIPVGTVEGVLSESAGWERTYLLRPAVHPAEASHVLILAAFRSADTLTAAYPDSLAASPPSPDTLAVRP